MPWQTPPLEQLRALNRDNVTAQLRSGPMIPNSVLRVLADMNAGAAYLTLLYIDWLADQLMPDTAEDVWLDRFGQIWLVNADGSRGRKLAAFASGSVTVTGIAGTPVPSGSQLTVQSQAGAIVFQTTAGAVVGAQPTPVSVVALTAGSAGNLAAGTTLGFAPAIAGIDGNATVVTLANGADRETDDELRARVLERIREPPMGGDAEDYVAWALKVPGVTRAWCSPLEMGIGTVTLRFMMDDLRATSDPTTDGFPLLPDVTAVQAYIDSVRPVTVKDFFVVAPIPEPVNFSLSNLSADNAGLRAAIAASVDTMLLGKAKPAFALNGVGQSAQTIYAAWVSDAVLTTPGVDYFDLTMADHAMPDNGHMGVLGSITYA
jgi:uncharacterized phage protein gp47/JayE